jgi:hypothetical protein
MAKCREATSFLTMRVLSIGVVVALVGGVTAAFAAPPVTEGIYGGVVSVGRGAAGVTLGMTRAQVIARLGRPLSERGAMSYESYLPGKNSPRTPHGMFDLLLANGRVRMIVISPHYGWHLSDGIHIFASGAIARLMHRFGRRLKPTRIEDGERAYRITGRYLGRVVWTEFYVERFEADATVYGFDMLFPLAG